MSDQQFRPAHSAFDESPEVKEAANIDSEENQIQNEANDSSVAAYAINE